MDVAFLCSAHVVGHCLTTKAYTAMVETSVLVVNFSSDLIAEISREGAVWTKVCGRLK
jgi:hypothetical protein